MTFLGCLIKSDPEMTRSVGCLWASIKKGHGLNHLEHAVFSLTNPKKTWLLQKKGLTAPKGGALPPGAFLGDTLLTSFESEKIAEKTGGNARLGAGPFFPGSEIDRLCKHRSAIIGSMVLLYIIYIFTWFLWDQLVSQVNIPFVVFGSYGFGIIGCYIYI